MVPWTDEEKAAFLLQQFTAQDAYYRDQFPDADFLVVEDDGEPVGRLYLHRRDDEIRVMDIALLPGWRGLGVGGALLRDVLEEARRAGKPVRIHVERNNPAVGLYERLGFRPVGDTGVYFLMEAPPAGA